MPFLLKTDIANLYSLFSFLNSAKAFGAFQLYPWGFTFILTYGMYVSLFSNLLEFMCDWEQLAG